MQEFPQKIRKLEKRGHGQNKKRKLDSNNDESEELAQLLPLITATKF
jgi:hypothetical protein